MTASALTRPGERDRLSTKITELDWRLVALLCLVAFVGTAMLYSIAGGDWQPWAIKHAIRFGLLLVVMLGLAMLHPKWWFRAAYPLYGVLLLLVLMIEFTPLGYVAGGARNWLNLGFIRIQPASSWPWPAGITVIPPRRPAGPGSC
jgi:rod shape determining protein RodA